MPLPEGKKPIGCKQVYKIKLKEDGSLEWHKSRLVSYGFSQTKGIDCFATFSLIAKVNKIRLLLAIVVANQWSLQQLDIYNVFLHGNLNKDVYMELPPRTTPIQPN